MEKTIGPTSFTFKGIVWGKVAAGAGVAIVGALLTYFSSWIVGQDFGSYTTVVMAVWTVIANIGRKWVSDQE